jgi:hypothetical protein
MDIVSDLPPEYCPSKIFRFAIKAELNGHQMHPMHPTQVPAFYRETVEVKKFTPTSDRGRLVLDIRVH